MVIITGSLAFDHIMNFPDRFAKHILPDKVHVLSLSFEMERLAKRQGGTAGNIAYNLTLLGEKPMIVAAAGADFGPYRRRLETLGVDCSQVIEFADYPTAQAFVMTDLADNQISAFYAGAMVRADQLVLENFTSVDLIHIAPDNARAIKNHVQSCQEQGWPYIFDPGQQIIKLTPQELQVGISRAKLVVGNDYEISLLEEKTGLRRQEMTALVEALIVTLGDQGSRLFFAKREVVIAAVKPGQVVDPTGAGDAFRAGLIKGMVTGLDWETTAKLGSSAASFAVESYGTQEHHFTLEDVKMRYQATFGEKLKL